MSWVTRVLTALIAALVVGSTALAQTPPIVAEARAFMDGYAKDLIAGDRAAIVARYSRKGAYSLGVTPKRFQTHEGIAASYADWRGPAAFSWEDLSFEPVGKDAVLVVGGFKWTRPGAPAPGTLSYTGLLVREGGRLMIRVEHENPVRP